MIFLIASYVDRHIGERGFVCLESAGGCTIGLISQIPIRGE
jgi:hypothetical protein